MTMQTKKEAGVFTYSDFKNSAILECRIAYILRKLHISVDLKGYNYLKYAIQLVYEDRSYADGITKKLYPDVAKYFGTSAARVERSIRHAIEESMMNININDLEEYIGEYADKYTNTQYICGIVECLHLSSLMEAASE